MAGTLSVDLATKIADVFTALSDPTRVRIVYSLLSERLNVTQLSKMLKVDIVNMSHHLGVLHSARLVTREREGRFIWYSLDPEIRADGRKLVFHNIASITL